MLDSANTEENRKWPIGKTATADGYFASTLICESGFEVHRNYEAAAHQVPQLCDAAVVSRKDVLRQWLSQEAVDVVSDQGVPQYALQQSIVLGFLFLHNTVFEVHELHARDTKLQCRKLAL